MTAIAVVPEERPLVRLQNVAKRFGTLRALDGVDLEIYRAEVLCIIGPSGCGKSTLLRCINGLHMPDSGRCVVDGQEVVEKFRGRWLLRWHDTRDLEHLRSRVGMVFQSFNVWPHLSVLENVTKALLVVKREDPQRARNKAIELLTRVGLGDKIDAFPHALSGGQQQRVAIARALALDPILMLFDEPTSSLDPELVGEVLSVMQELAGEGMTMVVVTHELGFAARVAHRLVFMEGGQIVEVGPVEELLRRPRTGRLKEFLSKLL